MEFTLVPTGQLPFPVPRLRPSSFRVPDIPSAVPLLLLRLEHHVRLSFTRVSVCNTGTTDVCMSATLLTLLMTQNDKELRPEYHSLSLDVPTFVIKVLSSFL